MLKIAIIAGEPSGDMLAARLMHALREEATSPIQFMGIGGDNMQNEGFTSSYNMDILSVGGYSIDVFMAIPKILQIRQKIIKEIIDFKPDVFIGVDAPDFNFYVEKKLREAGIKTVHYVSPTIWAWRYERIFKVKKSTDLMLCIFPMEAPMYHKENIRATFIGHHLADQIELDINTEQYKEKLQLSGKKVFTILVGSRKREVNSLGEILVETCNRINSQVENAVFVFPILNEKIHALFEEKLANARFEYKVLINQTADCIKASDMVLAKSGTVTLEVALCKKPMVIVYKVSKFTEWILSKRLKIKFVGQPNILSNEFVVPELLQDHANPEELAREFLNIYHNKERQKYIIDKFYDLHRILKQNASVKGAQAVLELINS